MTITQMKKRETICRKGETVRRIAYKQSRGIWSDLVVLTTSFFPFQIYPIVITIVLFYLIVVRESLSLKQLLYPCCLATILSMSCPLYYWKDLDRYNFMAKPMISWHKSVTVVLPSESFPRKTSGYVFAVHPHGRVFVSFSIILFFYRKWLMQPLASYNATKKEEFGNALEINNKKCLSKSEQSLLDDSTNLFFGVTSTLFALPVLRNVFGLIGLVSATKSVLKSILLQSNHVALLVGGVQEVCLGTFNDKDILYLKKRKGFLKLAMETGSGVVPVYCFGENRLFKHTNKTILKCWKGVNRYVPIGAPFPVCGPFNLMIPYRGDLLMAFGEPLFPRSDETIDQFHGRYMLAIEELFQKFVKESSSPNLKLEIL